MTIPCRRDAARLLLECSPPAWFLAHAAAVAEIATFLATRLEARGVAVQRALVEAAALLHDIDKLLPADDPLLALGHGAAGAVWLARRGHPELADPVAAHPVMRLVDDAGFRSWAAHASREDRIVAYADKRAGQRLEPLAERFAAWSRRDRSHLPELARARPRAERLERDVCDAVGLAPQEIRRLRWVAPALAAARRNP